MGVSKQQSKKFVATNNAAKIPNTLIFVIGDKAVTTKAANVVKEVTACIKKIKIDVKMKKK